MAVSAAVLARLDRVKTVAIVIDTHHKTERTGGALTPYTLRVTDARFLRDGGDVFLSRLLTGYQLEESTGARNPPSVGQARLPRGTSIKGGTEANRFRFEVSNVEDPASNTLDDWQELALCGSTVAVYRGAEMDESGASYGFDDYAEVFYGRITACERGQESWTFEALSPEGWRSDWGLVRRAYTGDGFGVALQYSPSANAYLSGSGAAFTPTAGKYSFSCRIGFVTLPSSRVGNGAFTVFRYEESGGTAVLNVSVTEADDQVRVEHWDGTGDALTFTGWKLTADDVGIVGGASRRILALGIRWDGSTAYLYVDGEQVGSGSLSVSPRATGTVVVMGRAGADVALGDFAIYEAWLSDDDVGDAAMRARQGGPLVYLREGQEDLWLLYKFLEGALPVATETDDLVYDGSGANLSLNGPAAFIDSKEGDDPDIGGGPRGDTKPWVIGGPVFNFPVTQRNRAGLGGTGAVYDISASIFEAWRGRVDGARLQVYFSLGITPLPFRSALLQNVGADGGSALSSEYVARRIIPEVRTPDGQLIRPGSEIEISESTGQDGVYSATVVRGETFVFVEPTWPGTPSPGDSIRVTVPASSSTPDLSHFGGNAQRSVVAGRSFQGQITVDGEDFINGKPNATEAYVLLRNVRDRDEATALEDVSDTAGHVVTWVGADGERYRRWAFGIAGAADVAYENALSQLLESYFMWTTDTARVGADFGVRAGIYQAPDGSGNVYSAAQVVDESIRALSTLPPAWRVVVRYRPNYANMGERQIRGVMDASERRALARDASEIEVFRDTSIRNDFEGAREVYWTTTIWDQETAIRIGQSVADFVRVPRTWWAFRAMIRPEAEEIGNQVTFNHPRFGASSNMVVHGKAHGIAPVGVDLVTVS